MSAPTETSVLGPTGLRRRRLAPGPAGLAAAGVAVAAAIAGTKGIGPVGFVLLAACLGAVGVLGTTWLVEGRRRAVDRFVTGLAWTAFLAAVTPLGLVLGYTVAKGAGRLDGTFLAHSMAGLAPSDPGGGAYHALVGTLEQVGLASAVALPVGLGTAIYLTEYGSGRLPAVIRFFVDVMTGIPSIVAGLFIYSFWVLGLGLGFSGLAGALALAVLMLPILVRSAEEMLQLVPGSLREAGWALGLPRWRVIVSLVLPTAAAGLTTGVLLGIARIAGETAPLILTVFGTTYIHLNPLAGKQEALPLYVYNQAHQAYQPAIDRAWAGALMLIIIVLVLYATARIVTHRFTRTGR